MGHKGHTQTSLILKTLLRHEVVGKLKGNSVIDADTYFLTADGCRYLLANKDTFAISSIPRHAYRSDEATQLLIQRSRSLLDIYLKYVQQHGDGSTFRSKIELGSKYPLQPSPDAEIVIGGQLYIVELFLDGLWRSLLARRLHQLYVYWQMSAGTKFLLCVYSLRQQQKIVIQLAKLADGFAADCEVRLVKE